MSWKDLLPGGRADKSKPEDFSPKELRQGAQHETEHTKDRHLSKEIAMDHLKEDPKYYEKLEKMEKSAFWQGFSKQARELTTKARNQLPAGDFVFPKERRYPIHDRAHARNALARVAQNGSPAEQKAVRSAVRSKFPDIDQD